MRSQGATPGWEERRCGPALGTVLGLLGFLALLAPVHAVEELRGLWVDTFHSAMRNEAEVVRLVADARAGGFNALFVEVRKRGDAYYDSRFEPRAADVAPGFDPLGRLVEVAHDTSTGPRLEVHAWVVAFNIWNSQASLPSQPDHPYRLHPDWLTRSVSGALWDGANYALDPGHPAVQEHTFNVAMDLVRRYDIDGLHWDYVRYAGKDWGYNDVAVERFNRRFGRTGRPTIVNPDWLQFRRDQVTGLVRKVYLTALAEKPSVRVSAATITFAPGITTTSQWPSSSAYSDVLQDWRAWMEEGILDWNIPMAYFRQTEHPDAFTAWNVFIKDHQYRRRAAIGLGWYLNSVSNAIVQTRLTRRVTPSGRAAGGVVGYSYAAPVADASRSEFFAALRQPSRFDPQTEPVFAATATVPASPWKTSGLTGHVMGYARDAATERGLDGAEVTVCGPVNRVLRTDATGFFGAVDLPPGDYAFVMAAPGHEAASADTTVRGGAVASLEFPLVAVDPANPGDVRASAGADSAVISWNTPAPATGWVLLGSTNCAAPVRVDTARMARRHAVLLTGFRPSADHRFEVFASAGTLPVVAVSDPRSIRTAPAASAGLDRPDPERVPGWWARHFFGSNAVTAGGDEDRDGLTNAAEYLLGTDPMDPDSVLQVRWATERGGGPWRVGFRPRVAGRKYELHLLEGDGGGAWARAAGEPAADGAGGGVFEVEPSKTTLSSCRLRVAAVWP